MTQFKYMYFIFLLMTLFSSSACADSTLVIKPIKIDIFVDDNVFAMDESGKYQVGQIGGKWSGVRDIKKLGLSLLDHSVATKDGLFLIGAESKLDADNNTYYTALIVLLDSSGKNVKEWRNESNFHNAAQYNNTVLLTSFDGVYTISAAGDLKRIKDNDARVQWMPLYDNTGSLILCRPASLAKIVMIDGFSSCVKEGGWTFSGDWYASNDDYTTEPVVCGAWIVEAVQKKHHNPISEIIVRSLKSGEVITKQKIPDTKRMFCLNNSKILIDTGMQSYTLPDMNISDKYSCNKDEAIVSVKSHKNESACLTSTGYLGVLKNRSSK